MNDFSTPENIHAGISVLVDADTSIEHLDAVLTTLRKHGIAPKFYEYEPERDAPEIVSDFSPEVLEEQRDTSYNSMDDETTVRITQRIKGSI